MGLIAWVATWRTAESAHPMFADMPKQISFTVIDKDQTIFRQCAHKNPSVVQNA
jgi:hypothetical protein